MNTPTQNQVNKMSNAQVIQLFGSDLKRGLTSQAVKVKRSQYGWNEIVEEKRGAVLQFLAKFWGPSAWMLEAIAILSFYLGKRSDFYVILGLLLINAVVTFFQEKRAQKVVEMLQSKLQVKAKVLRNGSWLEFSARELVPGDIVRLRMGDYVPADIRVLEGTVQVDQSSLTGESKEQTKGAGDEVFSGSIVRQGEFLGEVMFTGSQTYFGHTLDLVENSKPKLHMDEVVSKLVRVLFTAVSVIVVILVGVGLIRGTSMLELLPLSLVLLMATVPIALPVMFTVSTAVGAKELGKKGVLVTRLSATEDASTMQVLCVDKTGTITENQLAVKAFAPEAGVDENTLLLHAALASNAADRDSIDDAILSAAHQRSLPLERYTQVDFIPFSPKTRMTEATLKSPNEIFKARKGALETVAQLDGIGADRMKDLEKTADEFASRGYRTLAVSRMVGTRNQFLGLIALYDPPRPDSKSLIDHLHELGVTIKMLTGDATPVANQVATEVGLKGVVTVREDAHLLDVLKKNDGIAEVFPDEKFRVIKAYQDESIVVGMTGDGVNDSPALQEAEVGIAVKGATDAAKAAASVVLTETGLSGIVDLVMNGRSVHQRVLTWVVNKISRTILKAGFVAVTFLLMGRLVISALGMLMLIFLTDFVKITLATDHVRPTRQPDSWKIGRFDLIATILGIVMVVEALVLLWVGTHFLGIQVDSPQLQTYSFLILLFMALFSILSFRERGAFWNSMPGRALCWALAGSALLGVLFGIFGFTDLPAIPVSAILVSFFGSFALSLILNDRIKVALDEKR